MRRSATITGLIASIILASASPSAAEFRIDVESGAVFSGYNDVRIPGDTGTQFSLSEDLESDPKAFVRARLEYSAGGRHNFSILIAPLRIESSGSLDRALVFEDTEFPADTALDAIYEFNSYRLTYRYDFRPGERFQYGLGFTGKIRDALVSVEGGGQEAEKTNVGFVPLINFMLRWKVGEDFALLVEGDALAAPQGRAEDVLLAIEYRPNDRLALRVGYRILEGGADNDEVYNFALLNYASMGAAVSF